MKRLSGPIDVQLELTERCNFRCRHCYNYWRYDDGFSNDQLNATHFIRILTTLHDSGVSVITLTGGEPLLRQDVLFPVLHEAKIFGMEVGLNTNATLVTQGVAERLASDKLDHVLCSLLGTERTHNQITNTSNGFAMTKTGIENLVKTGVPVAVNMVVSKLNQTEIMEVGKIVSDLGVRTFCATPMVPSHESNREFALSGTECKQALRVLMNVGKAYHINFDTLEPIARCLFNEGEEDEFLSFFGNRICSAAVTSCAISSTGMVRPCIHADKTYGNILDESFAVIWSRMSPWSDQAMLPHECVDCVATAICEGGCRMSSKITNGCYDGKDMYMSTPISDKERVVKLPNRIKPELRMGPNEILSANPLVRLRQESFGGIVYVGNRVVFLSNAGFQLIRKMLENTRFTIAEVARKTGHAESDIEYVVLKLFNIRAILREEGGDKNGREAREE